MLVRFSQKWAKEKYQNQIREAINFVKGSRSCKGLLIKVFFYKEKGYCCGNYRNVRIHGFYGNEWGQGISSVITLKLSDRTFYDPSVLTEQEISELNLKKGTYGRFYREHSIAEVQEQVVELFAHEFKHYLDMRDLQDKTHFRHWEVRAKRFSEKKVNEWKEGMKK